MNLLFLPRLKQWWWHKHHIIYFQEAVAPPPIQPSKIDILVADDSKNIQAAIDRATKITHQEYLFAKNRYDSKWYRFLLKKPLLEQSARLQAGKYIIGVPPKLYANVRLEGVSRTETTVKTGMADEVDHHMH